MLAVILTGGKSSRMGRDKAMLPVAGVPMARLLTERFRAAGFEVAVSVDRADSPAEFFEIGAGRQTDHFRDFTGIPTGLRVKNDDSFHLNSPLRVYL